MENTNKITQEEISKIQEINAKFNQGKIALGDCELQKQNILKGIEQLKIEFSNYEKILIDKYGANSVINIQTGELKQKTD